MYGGPRGLTSLLQSVYGDDRLEIFQTHCTNFKEANCFSLLGQGDGGNVAEHRCIPGTELALNGRVTCVKLDTPIKFTLSKVAKSRCTILSIFGFAANEQVL